MTPARRPATAFDSTPPADLVETFDAQADRLVALGYPALAGLTEPAFRDLLAPLRQELGALPPPSADNAIPFVIVVTRELVRPDAVVPLLNVNGKPGWTDMPAAELALYHPIDGVELPERPVYLLADIDTGEATLNVRPNDALPLILEAGRTPLTIDEGLAVVLQYPDIFTTHNAFQLLASRCGDKRVPTVWLSYKKPRLGWCWAGNPHTWLGSASTAARIA